MSRKPMQLIKNEAGGIDLLTERDVGNKIRILTGNTRNSKEFWKRMRELANEALVHLSEIRKV